MIERMYKINPTLVRNLAMTMSMSAAERVVRLSEQNIGRYIRFEAELTDELSMRSLINFDGTIKMIFLELASETQYLDTEMEMSFKSYFSEYVKLHVDRSRKFACHNINRLN